MTTREELNDSFDRLSRTVLQIKAERDALLRVCKRVLTVLDDIYDVDQPHSESAKEYPFSGAGELMTLLRSVIEKAEHGE